MLLLGATRPDAFAKSAAAGALEPGKSYLFPAAEILGFQFLLNRFDNRFVGSDYNVSLSSIRRNLHHDWVEDKAPFSTNQFSHPYQGASYYGLARSSWPGEPKRPERIEFPVCRRQATRA